MADIVAIAAYRAVDANAVRRKESGRVQAGPATLLLFTGVRRETIEQSAGRAAGLAKDRALERHRDIDH